MEGHIDFEIKKKYEILHSLEDPEARHIVKNTIEILERIRDEVRERMEANKHVQRE